MDPEFSNILRQRGPLKPFLPQVERIEEYRAKWSLGTSRFANSPLIQQSLSQHSTVVEQDLSVPIRDKTFLKARHYRPQSSDSRPKPLVVFFHGGGFCLGGLDTEDALCRLFCSSLGIIVLNVAYRLAPEHPWPCGLLDSLDATIWAVKQAKPLGASLQSGFVVGGVSAGATFAAIISHLWRDMVPLPRLTGVFLSIPILSDEVDIDGVRSRLFVNEFTSITQNRRAPMLNETLSDRFWSIYKPNRSSPLFTPFLFKHHRDVPQTYLQACGLDPYRDGCHIYEGSLRLDGTRTKLDQYHGLPHGFWTAYPDLSASSKWLYDSIAGMGWLLQTTVGVRSDYRL